MVEGRHRGLPLHVIGNVWWDGKKLSLMRRGICFLERTISLRRDRIMNLN
jgi:hypothetical protein